MQRPMIVAKSSNLLEGPHAAAFGRALTPCSRRYDSALCVTPSHDVSRTQLDLCCQAWNPPYHIFKFLASGPWPLPATTNDANIVLKPAILQAAPHHD